MKNEINFASAFKSNFEKISNSDIFLSLVTQNYLNDAYCALQIGIALLLDKPIVVVIKEGIECPNKLAFVAKDIFYFKDDDDLQRIVKDIAILLAKE